MLREENEIGDGESLNRQKRAVSASTPIGPAPASAPISPGETQARKRRASTSATPKNIAPSASPISAIRQDGAAGEGHRYHDTHEGLALAGTTTTRSSGPQGPDGGERAKGTATPNGRTPASAPTSAIHQDGAAGEGHGDSDTHVNPALAGTTTTRSSSPQWLDDRYLLPLSKIDLITTRSSSLQWLDGGERANGTATPKAAAPASAPTSVSHAGGAAGEGHNPSGTQPPGAPAGLTTNLVEYQRRRMFAITQMSRADRSIESLIAQVIGFRVDATEKQRKEVFAQAKVFRLAVEKGEGLARFSNSFAAIVPHVLASAAARQTWNDLRSKAEKDMAEAAKHLPVYEFVKSVKGFGVVGLAAVCAEAGIPVGDYRTVSGFWKRMGVAVINGERQQRKRGKDEAAAHGYSPKRRSQVWQFFSDSMFKHQWVGDKDEDGKSPSKTGKPVAVPAHPAGPYGEVYYRRLQHTTPRIEATEDLEATDPAKWSPMRCQNDARRVMSKAVLRDLWRVWRGMPPRGFGDAGPG